MCSNPTTPTPRFGTHRGPASRCPRSRRPVLADQPHGRLRGFDGRRLRSTRPPRRRLRDGGVAAEHEGNSPTSSDRGTRHARASGSAAAGLVQHKGNPLAMTSRCDDPDRGATWIGRRPHGGTHLQRPPRRPRSTCDIARATLRSTPPGRRRCRPSRGGARRSIMKSWRRPRCSDDRSSVPSRRTTRARSRRRAGARRRPVGGGRGAGQASRTRRRAE